MFFIGGIVDVLLQPPHFPGAETADYRVGHLVVVRIFLRFVLQLFHLILHQIDGKSVPYLASRDPVGNLPVVLVINEKQAVRIDPVRASAGQAVEKAAGERVK